MTEEEMIENLAESAKKEHICNEIRDLLNTKYIKFWTFLVSL